MGLIVATSRGNGLTSLKKEKNTKLMVFPGGKLRDMAQAAVNTLSSFPPSQSTNTVLDRHRENFWTFTGPEDW